MFSTKKIFRMCEDKKMIEKVVRSTLPNISESGPPSELRGTFNELEYGKVSFFQSGEKNYLKSNKSRNIDFYLLSEDEFCAIIS